MALKHRIVLLLVVTGWACSSNPPPKPHETGGSGGDEPTGGRTGTGGSSAKPDAGAPKPDAAVDAAPTSACASGAKLLICDPLMKMPKSIKETGVYPSIPDLSKHADQLIAYSPEPALWSDGLAKERFLLLPDKTQIDTSDPKKWVFPFGTVFVKSFFADNHKIIETRFIRLTKDDPGFPYEYYTYKWNAAGTDAVMEGWMDGATFDPRGALWDDDPVMVTLQGKPHTHPIPSHDHCGDCHNENRKGPDFMGPGFIGFDEIRLNHALPGAQQTQLEALAAGGLFTKPPGKTVITGATPLETRVKRFLFGNCVHCHNSSMGTNGNMDLSPDVFLANLRNAPITGHVEAPPGFMRVVPGKPLMSVAYVQAARMSDMINKQYSMGATQYHLRDMPPVGVTLAPTGANLTPDWTEGDPIKDLFDWITALK